jgi:hypothetical protein
LSRAGASGKREQLRNDNAALVPAQKFMNFIADIFRPARRKNSSRAGNFNNSPALPSSSLLLDHFHLTRVRSEFRASSFVSLSQHPVSRSIPSARHSGALRNEKLRSKGILISCSRLKIARAAPRTRRKLKTVEVHARSLFAAN